MDIVAECEFARDDADAAHVGCHPQQSVGHLLDVEHIVAGPLGVRMPDVAKSARLGVEQGNTPVGAHPDAAAAIFRDASHVVAGQTGVVVLTVAELPGVGRIL